MILLDTAIMSLVLLGKHTRIKDRMQSAPETPVTSIVSRIEVLQGRFDAVLKAADYAQLESAQNRLLMTERVRCGSQSR